jgi:hypothetical protein
MAMSPSQRIIAEAQAEKATTDSFGRKLLYRRLGALDRAKLFKAIGGINAQNAPYLGMAMLACSCTEVDGVPLPFPSRESDVDAAIARLDDEGLEAIATALVTDEMEKETADAGPKPEADSPAAAAPPPPAA